MTPDQCVFWMRGYFTAGGADLDVVKKVLDSVPLPVANRVVAPLADKDIVRELDRIRELERIERERTTRWPQRDILCADSSTPFQNTTVPV